MAEAVEEAGAENAEQWLLRPEELDGEELAKYGRILDQRPASLRGWTVGMALAEQLLQVRSREGRTAPLKANAAQQAFEWRRGERNIVLKARQMGLTTWAAAGTAATPPAASAAWRGSTWTVTAGWHCPTS